MTERSFPPVFSLHLVLPSNIVPILISSATQQALQICVDEDLTQENNTKMVQKEALLNDIQTNGQASNFFEFQQQIQVRSSSISIAFIVLVMFRIIRRMKLLSSMIMIISIRKTFVCSSNVALFFFRN